MNSVFVVVNDQSGLMSKDYTLARYKVEGPNGISFHDYPAFTSREEAHAFIDQNCETFYKPQIKELKIETNDLFSREPVHMGN